MKIEKNDHKKDSAKTIKNELVNKQKITPYGLTRKWENSEV